MMTTLHLIPAYGRRYTSIDEARDAWNLGLDFKIRGGPYCSSRDVELLKKSGYTRIEVCFVLPNDSFILEI